AEKKGKKYKEITTKVTKITKEKKEEEFSTLITQISLKRRGRNTKKSPRRSRRKKRRGILDADYADCDEESERLTTKEKKRDLKFYISDKKRFLSKKEERPGFHIKHALNSIGGAERRRKPPARRPGAFERIQKFDSCNL
ncbi:MAG: hypothetical protein GWP14_07890, partial [Actinobacteria bacterium]|nr:hypothetical protein [Actinomycetota bacterium]